VRERLRDQWAAVVLAAAGVWAMTYAGLSAVHFSDYDTEVKPAYDALLGGHLWRSLSVAPAYGGSVVLRAPFAFLPSLWGGGAADVYRAVSIPCLLAAALLGIALVRRMAVLGSGRLARLLALGLCIVNPITVRILEIGHPEEILGAALCVGAVLVAQRGKAGWAGLLLGLAIANKEWGLLAVAPVLLALPGRRVLTIATAAAVATAVYFPLVLPTIAHHGALSGASPVAGSASGTIFNPWQLWWFLGSPGHLVNAGSTLPATGYRHSPAWLTDIPHPLIVALSVPLFVLARRRRADPLMLMALLFALRCALDPWDIFYYAEPFLLTLTAWESLAHRRPPVISLLAGLAVWFVFLKVPGHVSADQSALVFAALAVPGIAALAIGVFRPSLPLANAAGRPRRRAAATSVAG
jgi:hypothetical protein